MSTEISSKYELLAKSISDEVSKLYKIKQDQRLELHKRCTLAIFQYIMNKPNIDEYITLLLSMEKEYGERIIFTTDEYPKVVVFDDEKILIDVTKHWCLDHTPDWFEPFTITTAHGVYNDDLVISIKDKSDAYYEKFMAIDDSKWSPEKLRMKAVYKNVYVNLQKSTERKKIIQNAFTDKIIDLIFDKFDLKQAINSMADNNYYALEWKDIDNMYVIYDNELFIVDKGVWTEKNGYLKLGPLTELINKKIKPFVCILQPRDDALKNPVFQLCVE